MFRRWGWTWEPAYAGSLCTTQMDSLCLCVFVLNAFPPWFAYSTTSMSVPLRPNVSGEYISSALAGGTTNEPGVVARAT